VRRFEAMEARLAESGKSPEQADMTTLDSLWNAVKSAESGDT
jgi:ATP diphosphatase